MPSLLRLQETADGNAVPFVAKALCLADLTIDPKIPAYREIDRNLIVDRGDLAAFETTWGRLFARRDHLMNEAEIGLQECVAGKGSIIIWDVNCESVANQSYRTIPAAMARAIRSR